MNRLALGLLALVAYLLSVQNIPAPKTFAAETQTTRHFITNLDGSKAPKRLGFDVFDINSGKWAVHALPKGVKGLVYLGQKCPTRADRSFKSTVRSLASSRKVYGYYLSDEPHIADCPAGPPPWPVAQTSSAA